MSEKNLTVLLGLHDRTEADNYGGYCRVIGYDASIVSTLEDMKSAVAGRQFGAYVMDLNLGSSLSDNVTPAKEVYGLIKDRIEVRLAKFMGISGEMITVEKANKEGIPATIRSDFNIVNFLRE